ncbi:MAG: endolytic transglycosylase MltG [Egibacteraceae bacterium]
MGMSLASKITLVAIAFVVAAIGGAVWALLSDDEGAAEPAEGEVVTVEIAEGSSASEVADVLAEAGVVDRAWQFSVMARIDGRGGQIRPGEYELETGMGASELLDELASGPPLPDSFRVTIAEGLTVEATLERIAEAEDSPFEVGELEEALVGVPLPEWAGFRSQIIIKF